MKENLRSDQGTWAYTRFRAADRTRADSSGCRVVAQVDADDAVKLFSRNINDVTASYPETAAALGVTATGRSLLVDGELVALNKSGQPDFGLLQRRMHVARPSAALLR